MADYIRVIEVGDIPPGSGHVTEVNGHCIAIFNVDGAFFALDNTCAHRGGPLGEGELDGEVVTCPWHSWEYNVRTGISLTTPSASVKTYEVKVDDDDVKILL
ncbi:MAG: non-heme iron oxygenase ferredoxin subunit [Nitrospira sp.]|nr:MAG: non-heme iron oxygenase ferredoxin subunit [Nitrospira sp.]